MLRYMALATPPSSKVRTALPHFPQRQETQPFPRLRSLIPTVKSCAGNLSSSPTVTAGIT